MNAVIPIKHLIVNSDSQARLLDEAGAAYDGATNNTPSTGGFILEGFLPLVNSSQLELLSAATRVIKETADAGAAGVIEFEVAVDSGVNKADAFHVRVNNPELVPTEFQQYLPLEKRYQLSSAIAAGTASDHTVAQAIVDTINADKHAHVTAAVKSGVGNEGIVELTAKEVGQTPEFYISLENASGGLTGGAAVNTTPDYNFVTVATQGSQPVHTYDFLKNIDWARDLDFDRNVEFQPEYGASYVLYHFEVNWTPKDIGGHTVPSVAAEQQAGRTGFKIWTKAGIALDTALDALATDMNV